MPGAGAGLDGNPEGSIAVKTPACHSGAPWTRNAYTV
jgi:hypothetical protein